VNLPIRSPFDLLIIALLFVFGGLLTFGFAFGRLTTDRTQRQSRRTQLPQSIVLVVCALTWWMVATRSTELETFSRFVFLGVSLSFVSSAVLAQLILVKRHFSWSLIASGISCGFYILALRELQILFSLDSRNDLIIALVASWVIIIGIWAGAIYAPEASARLNLSSLIYALALASMAAYAVALTTQKPALAPVAAGASLLLIADGIKLNHHLHGTHWSHIGDVIWLSYIFGQALLVFSNSTALTLMP
jgi:hypothetical protein